MSTKPDVRIREAIPADASAMLAYMRELLEEPGIDLFFAPDEFDYGVAREARFIEACARADNGLFLVAEIDDELVGALTMQGGRRQATRHVVKLGISVHRAWRDRGIGGRMMTEALAWAKDSDAVRRVVLKVFARNTRAIHLYEKHGFAIEGRHPGGAFRDGDLLEVLTMGRLM